MGKLEPNSGAVTGGGGEFNCAAVYPSPEQSLQLGRQNLHLFRFKNTRFDVIGGAFYFLMVVRTTSSLWLCQQNGAVLMAKGVQCCISVECILLIGHSLWDWEGCGGDLSQFSMLGGYCWKTNRT